MSLNPPRVKISNEDAIDNVVGATIFFAYIAAALALSGFLTWDLVLANKRRYTHSVQHEKGQSHARNTDRKIRTASSLAVFSFATLSYHMLNFLIRSHHQWTLRHEPFPSDVREAHRDFRFMEDIMKLRIWEWAKGSTLFEDFARVICTDPQHFWWTHLVLLYSFCWNSYMSVKGQSNQLLAVLGRRSSRIRSY